MIRSVYMQANSWTKVLGMTSISKFEEVDKTNIP